MGHSSTRARVAVILSLCLLLLSLLAPAAQASPLAPQWSSQAPATIGSNSCQPNVVLACTSLNGNVGNNSCNGVFACMDQEGNVGNDSCVGADTCHFHTGEVGNASCNGAEACKDQYGNVGHYSCNGPAACLAVAGDIGDCANNTVTPPIREVQPDARIRRSAGPLFGNDIYNGDGLDQSVTTAAGADKYRRFYVSIQNDDLVVSDSFRVTEFPAGPLAGFVYRYFKGNSNREITAAILGGTFTTPVLAPGEKYQIRVRVYIGPSASTGSTLTRLLQATSVANSTKLDVVGYSVRRR